LIKHLGLGWNEVRSMPLPYRRWMIERFVKDIESQKKASSPQSQQQQDVTPKDIDRMTQQMMKRFDKSRD